MTKTKATNVAMERVKSFVDRLEKMEEERKALGDDIRDIYVEAKGVGFDIKTLRWMVSERKIEASDRAERDSLREVYAHALSMAVNLVEVNGLSLRQAAKRTGLSKSSIHRALSVPDPSRPAGSGLDPATGEITPTHEMGRSAAEHATESISSGDDLQGEDRCLSGRVSSSDEQEAPAARGEDDAKGQIAGDADGACRDEAGETTGGHAAGLRRGHGASGGEAGPCTDAGTGSERRASVGRRSTEGAAEVRVEPTPPLGAVGSLQGDRVASLNPDDLEIPKFLDRRVMAPRESAPPRGGSISAEGTQ